MCGRFDNLIARDAYRGLFKVGRLPKSNFPLRYAPTDPTPIVRIDPRDGEREVVMARWGLIPFWMKEKPKVPHINARASASPHPAYAHSSLPGEGPTLARCRFGACGQRHTFHCLIEFCPRSSRICITWEAQPTPNRLVGGAFSR
jgi:hypothetical protein